MRSEPSEIEKLLLPKKRFWRSIQNGLKLLVRKENIYSFLNYHYEFLLSNIGLKKYSNL